MRAKDYILSLIVKDRPIDEYIHEGLTFVEGRKGSDFEVSFKNSSKGKVLVVPSIDGLSPLDGEAAGPESRGYIVAPGTTLIIPGWTLDDNQVARFTFENKDKSYASSSEEGAVNSGVVGVLVYAEKQEEKPKEIHHHHHNTVVSPPVIIPVNPMPVWPHYPPGYPSYPPYPRTWCGVSGGLGDQKLGSSLTASAVRSARATNSMAPLSGTATCNSTTLNSIETAGGTINHTAPQSVDSFNYGTPDGSKPEADEPSFGLGAGWGERTDFKINHTTFNRGDMVAQMLIYYDTKRALEKRGIVIRPQRTTYSEELPKAFAGLGCKPPPGWTG